MSLLFLHVLSFVSDFFVLDAFQDHVAGSLWISFICLPNLCSMVSLDCLHLSPKCLFILFICILSHVYLLYLFVPDIQHEDHVAMICRMLFLPAKDLCHVDTDDCTRNHRKSIQ